MSHAVIQQEGGKRGLSKGGCLLILCWMVFAFSFICQLSYASTSTQIEGYFSVGHAETGAVMSFFYLAYGVGHVVNGLLCKKYPLRYVIFGAMAVTGLANFAIPMLPAGAFAVHKYLWLVNGLVQSALWPSLIRLLSETLDDKELSKANVVMGTTVCTGTLLAYGGSVLFVSLGFFQGIFFTAGVIALCVAFVWLIAFPKLTAGKAENGQADMAEQALSVNAKKLPLAMWLFLGAIALLAVCNNTIKEGLIVWMPAILRETYEIPDWSTLLLTMVLPLLGAFAVVVAVGLYNKIPNFFIELAILYGVSGGLLGVVLGLLSTNLLAVTVAGFGLVAMLMSAVNGVITSMIPLYMREKLGNSGMIAGVLMGFCYVGSTIASYGLGALAEGSGWTAVLVLFIVLCAFSVLLGGAGAIVQRRKQDAR